MGGLPESTIMIIGLFSDVHGNLVALKQCLSALSRADADKSYFLGDAVGYYPDGNTVLSLLAERQIECIRGNHDAMLVGDLPLDANKDIVYGLERQRKGITSSNTNFVKSWPLKRTVRIDKYNILIVHGSPVDPLGGYTYPDSDLVPFTELPYDIIFLGHTHRPFIREISAVRVVNVGSCGLPRDQGNLLSYAIFDTETGDIRILREEVDTELLLREYRHIHPSVVACIKRKPNSPVFGEC